MASLLAACRQNLAAAYGLHARAKSVRFGAAALARLICALWQSNPPLRLRVARGKSFTKSPNDTVLAAFAAVCETTSVLWRLAHGQEIGGVLIWPFFGTLRLTMNLRLFQSDDNSVLAGLFSETVRAINCAEYSPEQVEVWASDPPNIEQWCGQRAGRLAFVAERDSEIVGFATFEPNGHLDHLYVHYRFQRQGISYALLRRIEQEAASRGINRIFTEASLTARPFFERIGFRVIAPQVVKLKGMSFLNYLMEKLRA
ncbi:MAG TPA: GNAT family N-acetyltransferase [Candidatus Acidoferrum sp.]|nr:GNAT family N-acetyltransferase [Candidatus Acidoferrum sp.]